MAAIGIDTYFGDGHPIDWRAALGDGVSFAILKATEGGVADPAFVDDWQALGEVGMTRGAYHLLRPSEQASTQANFCLATVKAAGGLLATVLPISLDVELNGGMSRAHVIACARNFIDAILQTTQRHPIFYISPGFAEESLDDSFGDCALWVAHYTSAAAPTIPAGWDTWTFWQWAAGEGGPGTDVGGPEPLQPLGCPLPVDSDRFNGTHAELVARFGL